MSDQGEENKKPAISFGFSKLKPKTQVVKTESSLFKVESSVNEEDKPELIKSIQDNKINSISKPPEEVKPLIIPCPKNRDIIGIHQKAKEFIDISIKANPDDLAAVKALIQDAQNAKNETKDDGLVISKPEASTALSELEKVEDADYEAIDLEKFGKAALRGMGWNEKEGLGLTNKRAFVLKDIEVRPKGMGLGAGFSAKKPRNDNFPSSSIEQSKATLSYVKGAYVEVIMGKHENDLGQIVSFDDGLNRIMIKLAGSNETVSLLQSFTRLITKSDYERATKYRR